MRGYPYIFNENRKLHLPLTKNLVKNFEWVNFRTRQDRQLSRTLAACDDYANIVSDTAVSTKIKK